MQIKELKYKRRRTGDEISVVFEDNSVIALDAEVAVRFHIARGLTLTPAKLDEIRIEDEKLKARRRLITYLASRKKSTLECRRYLARLGFHEPAISEAIESAKSLGYINDEDYARSFVNTRTKSGRKGPRAVSAELLSKGISREEARKATEAMAEPAVQMENARKLAAKKYPTLKDEDDPIKAARRLSQHLARRGFDPEICDLITREFFGDPTVF